MFENMVNILAFKSELMTKRNRGQYEGPLDLIFFCFTFAK